MAVYYGVIGNNTVVLPDDVRLPDGVAVEVRPRIIDEQDDSVADEILRSEGLLEDEPPGMPRTRAPFEPVAVQGEPLSEQIIRERR